MAKLCAGVIGLGVGEAHARTYARLVDSELVAICDSNPARLQEVGDDLGVSARHENYRAITENPDIDIISICSYDDCHAEQAISAFRNGKHVFVEKPVALNRAEAEAVLRAHQDSGCRISSNLILRREPRFLELRKQIQEGAFGEIFCVEGDYVHNILWKITEGWRGKMDFYCTIFGGGIHLIDLMRWLLGQDIARVSGMGNKILTRGSDYRFPDTFINLFEFEGGALGKCLTTFGPQRTKFHSLNVYGTKKTFVNDMPEAKTFDGERPEDERTVSTPYRSGRDKGDLIPDFVEALCNDREPEVSTKDVFRVMDVCFAAWDSVQSGRTVDVSYLV